MSVPAAEIARWRVHNQALAGGGFADPAAVVSGMLGVQAENDSQASWAVATRSGASAGEFQTATTQVRSCVPISSARPGTSCGRTTACGCST